MTADAWDRATPEERAAAMKKAREARRLAFADPYMETSDALGDYFTRALLAEREAARAEGFGAGFERGEKEEREACARWHDKWATRCAEIAKQEHLADRHFNATSCEAYQRLHEEAAAAIRQRAQQPPQPAPGLPHLCGGVACEECLGTHPQGCSCREPAPDPYANRWVPAAPGMSDGKGGFQPRPPAPWVEVEKAARESSQESLCTIANHRDHEPEREGRPCAVRMLSEQSEQRAELVAALENALQRVQAVCGRVLSGDREKKMLVAGLEAAASEASTALRAAGREPR